MITTILLNYKRVENMPGIIEAIRRQTIESKIWIWDNSGTFDLTMDADVIIKSSENFYCQPRYMLCQLVKTPYVWTQDDDHIIEDRRLFEKLIKFSEEYPYSVLCMYGKNFRFMDKKYKDKWYSTDHVTGGGWVYKAQNRKVQMGATGLCFFPTGIFGDWSEWPFRNLTEKEMKYGDDLIFSYMRKMRVVPSIKNGVKQLDDQGKGLCQDKDHQPIRDKLAWRYWPV